MKEMRKCGNEWRYCDGECYKCVTPHHSSTTASKIIADVRDDATAHKLVCGGERDGATCWFECDNCGLSVDIGDVFCKHCGARFVP